MWRRFSTVVTVILMLFSLSSLAQPKKQPTSVPTRVWIGTSPDTQEPVFMIMQRFLIPEKGRQDNSALAWIWIDSRGPGLGEIVIKKPSYVPDGVLGVAMAFTARRTGLFVAQNAQAPPDFYGVIDYRPDGTTRVCYFDSKEPEVPKKLSLAKNSSDGAVCYDFQRLNLVDQCTQTCIAQNRARAVSARVTEADTKTETPACTRRCGGRFWSATQKKVGAGRAGP